ncbi:SasC/FmtB family protein [Staphylococcus warneri]
MRQSEGASFRAVPNQNNNDPLKYNETNTGVINGHFDQVSGGNLPNQKTSLTVVKDVIGWTSLSTDPDKEFPIVMTTKVRNYPTFMSDSSAPYGVVLARTTDGFDRRVPDPRVAGIYQDIDVAPNSELVVDFISSALATINAWPGVKAKITIPDGNRVLFDKQINGMGKYPTGKLNLMVNVPSDVDRVRLSFIPISNSYTLTSNQTNSAYGFGDNPNYMYGGSVSRVNVNSGAYVVSRVTEINYDFTSDSSTSNYARGTISVILENKGHTSSNETIYRVTLPQGTKFVSATNASTNYNEATGLLTLNAGKVAAGTTKTITYTVDFPAVKPSIVDLDGNVTYRTDASFRGNDRQKSGIDKVEQQQVAILMYKEDLRNKYNDTKQYLDSINEAKAILDEANNNVPMADRKNQDFINQITTQIEHEKTKLKRLTPSIPVMTTNEENASLTVTPQGDTDKMTVQYVGPNGDPKEVVATKAGDQWTLNETPTGFSIDNTNGSVTVNYQGVQNGSEVSAYDTSGNSDSSDEVRKNVPLKQDTPLAPTITPNETNASVTVTPQGDADKMIVHYVAPNGDAKEVIATKTGDQWALNESPKGISIDNTSGVVTVGYQAVQNGSEVIATEKYGNSDTSAESRANVPLKEATPTAPVITSDEANASVTLTPQGDVDKMTVHYVAPNGDAKEVIATKVGNQWTLNETPTGISIDNTSGAVTVGYQGVQNGSEVTANESHGNSDASAEARENVPVKEATPMAPTITSDEANASVTVTPQGDADKMIVHYVAQNGDPKEVIATKTGNQWTLNETPTGISIDNTNGAVTVGYQGVQNGSEVSASETHGNSDASTESRANVPVKEATPMAPTITSDEANASVTVTPQGDADKMIVHYGDPKEVIATKTGGQWALNETPTGISIDNTNGAVTINHQGVQNGSEVSASETHGNSDASTESRANVPVKEATPTAPVITSDETNASVTVTPQGGSDKMTVHYVAPNGDPKEVITTKVGTQWTLNETPTGISIDNTSGAVTVGYQGVQNGSEVTANESHGNSDASAEARANVPVKEATPTAPIITSDETNASVTVTPQGDVDKMTVHYVAPNGDAKEVIATKVGNQWTLNETPVGISIDNTNGAVTVNYQGVQNGSEVSASEKHGNSDTSLESRANVPVKEATPTAPIITSDETNASVTVTPQGDADKMTIHYVAPNGDPKEVIATKVGTQWTLNETPTGISIDNTSGAVTVSYHGIQNGSEVSASETHGNSDASTESRVNVPVKEATPMAPVIISDEANASVTVTPQGGSDKMTVHYVAPNGDAKEVIATKVGNQWTLNETPTGISIDNTSGAVTVGYQGVQNGSEVTANESHGNSDVSTETRANVPVKEATPMAPVNTSNEANASVTVTPQGNADKMIVHYVDPNGDPKVVIATKIGNQWALNEKPVGISIDTANGALTVGYQGVQNGSEVVASETLGNSDPSEKIVANVPVKQSKPMPPIIIWDKEKGSISIKPNGKTDKMRIQFISSSHNSNIEIIATKADDQWNLNHKISGIQIDSETGIVTIDYQIVQNYKELLVSSTFSNSDESEIENVKTHYVIKKEIQKDKIELPNTGKKQTNEKGNTSIVLLLLGFILCKLKLKRKDL